MSYDNRDCLYPGQHGDFCRCRWAIGREKGEVVLEGNSPLGPLDRARRVPAPLVAPAALTDETLRGHMQAIMERVRGCDEKPDADGHCACARYIAFVLSEVHEDRLSQFVPPVPFDPHGYSAVSPQVRAALRTPEEAERSALLEERYWCGCVRHARWDRCAAHGDLEHDDEPPRQREAERSSPEPDGFLVEESWAAPNRWIPVQIYAAVADAENRIRGWHGPRSGRIVPLYRRTPVEPAREGGE